MSGDAIDAPPDPSGVKMELPSLLMAVPARERLRAILERADAKETVEALSPQDFFFTVMELGREDAIPLLALARDHQIDFLFGLEWWRKDRVQPAKALQWMDLLARGSRGKLLEWLCHADFELLVSLFKKWIHVTTAPDEVDPLEAIDQLPPNTLDDHYYWDARYPQYEDLMKDILSLLFEVSQGFYGQLMHHIIWASEFEMEEEAYRFHRGRLEDEAIPDFFDSLDIYQTISTDEIHLRKDPVADARLPSSQAPSFALALVPRGDLLGIAVAGIQDRQVRDTLQWELAALANKVIAADRLSLEHPGTLRKALDKVAACISLGLEILRGEKPVHASEIVRTCFLEHLFRLGHTEAARTRKRLQQVLRMGWLSRWPHGLKCIDPEWQEAVELLLEATPRILRPGREQAVPRPAADHMRNGEDLRHAEELVGMIESLESVYADLDPSVERLQAALWTHGQMGGVDDATIGTMVLTAAANQICRGQWVLEPIAIGEWPAMFPRLNPEGLAGKILAGIKGSPGPAPDTHPLRNYMQPILGTYAQEMDSFLHGQQVPDPRFVRFFLFREK